MKKPGLFASLWLMVVTHLPGRKGRRLRYNYWKKRLKFLGHDVRLDTGIYFQEPAFIEIDDNCWIDRNVTIMAGPHDSARERVTLRNPEYPGAPGVVHIGKSVHIGTGCILSGISAGIYISDDCGLASDTKLYAFSHHYRSRKSPADQTFHFGPRAAHERQCLLEGPIFLGKNTGVAVNSILLPGASIPENCFISVASVVSRQSFKPNTVISGNPAKAIGPRFAVEKAGV